MNDVQIVDVLRLMATTGAKVAGPILLAALVVGVIVSIFQTITQIQEQSVAFLLKLAAVVTVMVIGGPWMLGVLRSFILEIWAKIPGVT
jgi:flagellar biosynthetic protein FliQ